MARILFLIDSLSFGGAERQFCLLQKYLSPNWERRVVSLGSGPYYQVLLEQKVSVSVYKRRSRFDLLPVWQLCSEILRYKPDIVQSWGGLCSAIAAPICKGLRIPFIDGSIRLGGASRHQQWRRRLTFMLSDYVIANSIAGLTANRIPKEKGSVIYNAMDPDRLKSLELKTKETEKINTVIMTGRISPFKDFTTFFNAARRLNSREPTTWKFVAIGAGEEEDRQNFVRSVQDLVDSGAVVLPHVGLEVLPYVQEANVGVLLSASGFNEGISNSIMEYMVCHLPVICSDSGGNRELVLDGETGFVIPPENEDAFIEKLLFLRKNPAISVAMGKAGSERVTRLCSIERMVADYEEIYYRLLRRRQNRSLENSQLREENGRGFS